MPLWVAAKSRDQQCGLTAVSNLVNLRVFLLVTLGQGLAEVRVWTQVKRGLALLVLDDEVGSVGGEEARDRRARLLVSPGRTQAHQQL